MSLLACFHSRPSGHRHTRKGPLLHKNALKRRHETPACFASACQRSLCKAHTASDIRSVPTSRQTTVCTSHDMATSDDTLVQFRAGLMKAQNNTLKADQRKGLVRLIQVLTWSELLFYHVLLAANALGCASRQMTGCCIFGGMNALALARRWTLQSKMSSFFQERQSSTRYLYNCGSNLKLLVEQLQPT